MKSCWRRRFAILPWLLVALPAAAAETSISLEQAVRMALQENLEIVSLRAEVEAARAGLRGASLLLQRNPEIEAAAGGRRSHPGTDADFEVQLSQPIEIAGQRSSRIEASAAALLATEARLEARQVEVAAEVRQRFGHVLATRLLLEALREGESMAQQGLDIALQRLKVGDATRIEFNTARVELGRASRERILAEQRQRLATSKLRLLLALRSESELTAEGHFNELVASPAVSLDAAIVQARESRADLRAARHEIEAASAEQRLASKQWLPSPRVGGSFAREEGADVVRGVLSFDLPVFNRYQAERGVAAARCVQAAAAWDALARRIEQEVRLAYSQWEAAGQAATIYASETNQAMRENLDLIREAYQAGEIDFTQLLLIRREMLEAQREHIHVLEELNSAVAQLERALGRRWW